METTERENKKESFEKAVVTAFGGRAWNDCGDRGCNLFKKETKSCALNNKLQVAMKEEMSGG